MSSSNGISRCDDLKISVAVPRDEASVSFPFNEEAYSYTSHNTRSEFRPHLNGTVSFLSGRLGSEKGGLSFPATKVLLSALLACVLVVFALQFFSGSSGTPESNPQTVALSVSNDGQGVTERATHGLGDSRSQSSGNATGGLASTEHQSGGIWSWFGFGDSRGTDQRFESVRGIGDGRNDRKNDPAERIGNRRRNSSQSVFDPAQAISGLVLTETGRALAGIEVVAQPRRLFSSESRKQSPKDEEWTLTNSEGIYRFEQLEPGEYFLHSTAVDGYAEAQLMVRTGVDFANLIMAEEYPCLVYGTVNDGRGQPLRGVKATPRIRSAQAALTDQTGRYELQLAVSGLGRTYKIRFELEGYRNQEVILGDKELLGREEFRLDVDLERIPAWSTVTGTVKDQRGLPVSGELVYLAGAAKYQAVTTEAGEFSMPEVEAGTDYRLSMRPRTLYQDYAKKVWVGSEGLTVQIELAPLNFGNLSGRILDPDGNSIPHFSMWLRNADASAHQLSITSDGSGRFHAEEVPAGSLSFTTFADPRFTISGINLSPGQSRTVDLTLDWGTHQVVGRVVDDEGNPVAAPRTTLYALIQENGVESRSIRQTTGDLNGGFRFANVGPVLHTISVHALGFRSVQLEYNSGGHSGDFVVQLQHDNQRAFQGYE